MSKAVFMIAKYDYEDGTYRNDDPEACYNRLRAALIKHQIPCVYGSDASSSCGITDCFWLIGVDEDSKWENALKSARVVASYTEQEDGDNIYDISDKKIVMHCSICGIAGHTKTTCKLNPKKYNSIAIQVEDNVFQRKKRKISV